MTDRARIALALAASLSASPGCGRVAAHYIEVETSGPAESDGDGIPGEADTVPLPGDDDGDDDDGDDPYDPDDNYLELPPESDDGDSWGCETGDYCSLIDLLFVIDNSATMGKQQLILSAALPALVDQLHALTDARGNPLNPDVNIMFTTTDVGHPGCTSLQPEGYMPAQGEPQNESCTERLEDFTGVGSDPPMFPEACTSGCTHEVAPIDPFIHFDGPMGTTTNVPGNQILDAMRCLAPQGINGCGYEAPLEAMFQALNPEATWNEGNKPFLRDVGLLAIVFVTDEEDCSVRSPEGYAYFTDPRQNMFWEVDPDTGTKTHPTSAVCWNAGVDCGAPDANGVYADCTAIDTGVLHPIDRYLTYLRDELIEQDKDVAMLGILGVPHVTAHNEHPPYQPTAGGVEDLVYREWADGDIIEQGETAASKEFEFGIGPGCTGEDGMGGFTGQAIPPVRIKEVCAGLDEDDQVRCCIESICDSDFSDAMRCLTGVIQTIVTPIG